MSWETVTNYADILMILYYICIVCILISVTSEPLQLQP